MAMAGAPVAEMPPEKVGFISALRQTNIRTLAFSRMFSRLAMATLSYGAMVSLAQGGSTQWQISLVASATYLSAVLFGIQGGTLSDALSKRTAIMGGFVAMAFMCFAFPQIFGTGVYELMAIMFLSSAIMQVISPSLKAAVSLVSSVDELATVAATVALAGSIASAAGSAVLAPLLVGWTNMTVLLAVCGALYLLGAFLAAKLPREQTSKSLRKAVGEVDWRPVALSRRNTADWLWQNRPIAVVILVGSVVFALFEAFNTLIPVYVRDVLHANPTNAIYIFAPAGIGFLFATLGTPVLVRMIGPRKLSVVAAAIMAISMVGFALIGPLAPILAPISPLRILGWLFNRDINDRVLAASTIAVPANFGSTAAGAAVQNYINAKVPLVRQGATFGVQEVQDNIFTLLIVLSLGALAELVGPKAVFFVAPIVAFLLVSGLIKYSYRSAGNEKITIRTAMDKLVKGYDDPPYAVDEPATPVGPEARSDAEEKKRDLK